MGKGGGMTGRVEWVRRERAGQASLAGVCVWGGMCDGANRTRGTSSLRLKASLGMVGDMGRIWVGRQMTRIRRRREGMTRCLILSLFLWQGGLANARHFPPRKPRTAQCGYNTCNLEGDTRFAQLRPAGRRLSLHPVRRTRRWLVGFNVGTRHFCLLSIAVAVGWLVMCHGGW